MALRSSEAVSLREGPYRRGPPWASPWARRIERATISSIRKDPGSQGKVGAVGFCLGGLLSYLTATRTDADASC